MMSVKPALVLCRLLVILSGTVHKVAGERHFFSYETVARSLDDGRKSFNEIRGSAVDSQQGSHSFHKTLVQPSRLHLSSNTIESKGPHRLANKPVAPHDSSPGKLFGKQMSAEQRKQLEQSFMQQLATHGGIRRGFIRRSNIRPRTVESPALSVDSGGRSSATSNLANAISKVFRVEHGHYSDIYNRIDNHKPLSTKRPAELIDETIEEVLAPSRHRQRASAGHRPRDD